MGFKFEKLDVWQRALKLSSRIHTTARRFPKEELYIVTAQIKRAADSVALNIAEGSTGQTNADFRRFLGYALRSAIEVVTCLYLARDRYILNKNHFRTLYQETESLVKMLQALRKSIH